MEEEEEEAIETTIIVADSAMPDEPVAGEQQPRKPGRPRLDPTISSQQRSRFHLQQHRNRRHLTRIPPVVQQDEGPQASPIPELSALTLHDGPPLSTHVQDEPLSEAICEVEPDIEPDFGVLSLPTSPIALSASVSNGSPPDAEPGPRPTTPTQPPHLSQRDGSPSEPSCSPRSTSSLFDSSGSFTPSASPLLSSSPIDSVLGNFLQAIHDQETAGGADFLRAQSDVYDQVLQAFFNRECDCKSFITLLRTTTC